MMSIEKKCIMLGAIWGLISLEYVLSTGLIGSVYGINLLALIENIIYFPVKIISFIGILMFGYPSRISLIIAWPFFILGTIFMGAFIGYLFSKTIKIYNKDIQ